MNNAYFRRNDRRLLRLGTILSVLCVAVFSPRRLKPQTTADADKSLEAVIDLPVFTSKEMYEALANSITDVGHARWGFPVDILAAAYGRYDKGWQRRSWWAPYLEKSRMRSVFSRSKTYVEEPTLPEFIAVNVPGKGLHHYDARYIRALVETDLFPYRMQIARKKVEASRVSYVILERAHAEFARGCFQEAADKSPPACPNEIDIEKKTHSTRAPASSFWEYGLAFNNPSPGDQAGRGTGSSVGSEWLLSLSLPNWKSDVKMLVARAGCEEFNTLLPAEQKELCPLFRSTKNVCLYTFLITVPRGTGRIYPNINLRGSLMTQGHHNVKCAPKDFDKDKSQEGVSSYACDFPTFSWLVGKPFTDPAAPRDARLRLALDAKDAQFWFCLEGTGGARTEHGCSCLPAGCRKPADDETLIKQWH